MAIILTPVLVLTAIRLIFDFAEFQQTQKLLPQLNQQLANLPPQSDWITYTSNNFHLSFNHPNNWHISEGADYIQIEWPATYSHLNLHKYPLSNSPESQIRSIWQKNFTDYQPDTFKITSVRPDLLSASTNNSKPYYFYLVQSTQLVEIYTLLHYPNIDLRDPKLGEPIYQALTQVMSTIHSL